MDYRIAEARELRGWSQAELARRAGTSQQNIQRWESGERELKVPSLIKLCDALGVSMSYLLGLDSESDQQGCPPDEWAEAPIYGSIAAGRPIEMEEADDWTQVPSRVREMYPGGFFLKVVGESIIPGRSSMSPPS